MVTKTRYVESFLYTKNKLSNLSELRPELQKFNVLIENELDWGWS